MMSRVLVVDDDPVNAELVGYLLRAFGHDAVLTLGGAEALDEARTRVPELVLCDIQMPGVDGFEIVRRLRADSRFDETPIIGLTALAMVGDRERVMAAGFDGYMTKPVTPETFVAEVEKYLPAEQRLADRFYAAQEAAVAHAPEQRPQRIPGYALIVDDSVANVQLMRHLVTSLGIDVRAVSSAAEALIMARSAPPRLIISDLDMLATSGIDLLEAAKADPALEAIPFLLIASPGASSAERQRGRLADDILIRPVDAEVLLEHLERWIPMERRP